MRRALLSWTLVFALLVAGFAASVLALNADLYSAGGFVRQYLEALQRHDVDDAGALDGVQAEGALVTGATVGGFDGIRIISDVEADGKHTVRAGYSFSGDEQVTAFTVERTGTRLGLFATWRFAVSPTATLAVAVDHDSRFTANGVDAVAGSYTVLVPSSVTLTHDTPYLEALPSTIRLTEVSSTVDALVEVAPTPAFTEAATAAIADFLDSCATQQVLLPTGCPFGTTVANRVNSPPIWSIVDYPTAALTPLGLAWQTTAAGTAHVRVEVKSIFDGSLSTLDADVPFEASYLVSIGQGDSLGVTLG
jgi:hypothetical protein